MRCVDGRRFERALARPRHTLIKWILPVDPTKSRELQSFSDITSGLTRFSCSDMECTMKFLASLERSGELIAVKCLQRREKASVSSILFLFVCLPRSIHFTPFSDRFSLVPRAAAHSSVIRSNTAFLAWPIVIWLTCSSCVLFQSPSSPISPRNSGTD